MGSAPPVRRPVKGDAVETAEEEIEPQADHAEKDEIDENLWRLQESRELEDAVAEPLVRRHQLRHHQVRPCPSVAQPQRVEHARQRRRPEDLAEDLAPPGAE